MRKKNQEIKDASTIEEIFRSAHICRIAMVDGDQPYIVPLNYGYAGNHLYFHCATAGRKLDLIRENPRVGFELEQEAALIKGELACDWATSYRSIIGQGSMEILSDFDEIQKGLEVIMRHHGATGPLSFEAKHVSAVAILRLRIETLSAKQSSNWEKIHNPESLDVETERLVLTEIGGEDLEAIHDLQSIPAVDEFNTLGLPDKLDDTRKVMAPALAARLQTPRASYTWKVLTRDGKHFIGLAGFFLSNDKFKLGEIYYKLHPDSWGKGYATEIARGLIKLGNA